MWGAFHDIKDQVNEQGLIFREAISRIRQVPAYRNAYIVVFVEDVWKEPTNYKGFGRGIPKLCFAMEAKQGKELGCPKNRINSPSLVSNFKAGINTNCIVTTGNVIAMTNIPAIKHDPVRYLCVGHEERVELQQYIREQFLRFDEEKLNGKGVPEEHDDTAMAAIHAYHWATAYVISQNNCYDSAKRHEALF